MDETKDLGGSEIQKVFAGATVLVTGGTGFVGKLLIEKLLRSCPDINKIYMLIRPKKKMDITKRFEDQFSNMLYNSLRDLQPNFTAKISAIAGDCQSLELGISEVDRRMLTEEVNLIFHLAATVRFSEPLKSAVQINVRGTRELLSLARDCTKLRGVVHMSTAYSNAPLAVIEERFYPVNLSGDRLIDLVEDLDEDTLIAITPGMIGKYPNTYTYTKAAAENILLKYGVDLPIAVVRPSIITCTSKEPLGGWCDNIYGPSGVGLASAAGLLHVLHTDPDIRVDIVPADLVVNTCAGVAWQLAKDSERGCQPPTPPTVYMCGISHNSSITWGSYLSTCSRITRSIPSSRAVYPFILLITRGCLRARLLGLVFHWLPACLVDGAGLLVGRQLGARKIISKMDKFASLIEYFGNKEWSFPNENSRRLYSSLSRCDRELFRFNFDEIDWEEYSKTFCHGVRQYLLSDPPETLPAARRRMTLLWTLHYFISSVLVWLAVALVWGALGIVFF